MKIPPLSPMSRSEAHACLREYKEHRNRYDKRDWEIERIYRAIARGNTVISVVDAIRRAGFDGEGRPKLAICQASALACVCIYRSDHLTFAIAPETSFETSFYNRSRLCGKIKIPVSTQWRTDTKALLPRIPPQYRPHGDTLGYYHMLWEADWQGIPADPYLLRRIGRDAWVVVAAWELTDVEMSVLRVR